MKVSHINRITRKGRARPVLAGLLCCVVAAATPLPASAQVIKLGTVAPEGSPWHDTLLEVGQKWKEISNGNVQLRIYAGGVAGDEQDVLRKMRIGQLHATAMTTPTLLTIIPEIEALSFPLLLSTDDELDYVIEKMAPRYEAQLEEKGFKVIGWSTAGWVHFFCKEPIVTVNDLRQHRLFFWGSDAAYVELMKGAGFNPIPLAITELLPSLQTGLIDTFAAPPAAALSFQWFGLAPHMTNLRWQPMPGTTVISTRQWEKVPEELRPKLEQAARESTAHLQERIRALEVDALAAMKKYGLQVHDVPPQALAEWQTLVREKGYPAFVGPRYSQEVYDAVKSARDEYRARQDGAGVTAE